MLRRILDSIYSPQFYATVPGSSTGNAFTYFLLLILVLAVIRSAIFGVEFFARGLPAIQRGAAQAFEAYPDELEVRVRNGEVSTNVQEPYVIRAPREAGTANLIVIDTRAPVSAAQYERHDTLLWLTRDSIVAPGDGESDMQILPLTGVDGITINKAAVRTVQRLVEPWLGALGPVLMALLIPTLYVAYLVRLLWLLVGAAIIWVNARISGHPLSYGDAYKVGLYAMTAALLIELAVSAAEPFTRFGGFPFMFTLITSVVAAVNLFHAARLRPSAPETAVNTL